ncbi:M48 family metalloprotease [Candidatus Woesearchaeota archaeon]|nr:M48 family metalloprotease [Candidatus Woesearchaeota archaeon]
MTRIAFDEVRRNKRKSVFMIFIFILLIVGLGFAIGLAFTGYGLFGLAIALLVLIIYLPLAYFSGDKMVLSAMGAKPVSKQEYPHLYHTIEGLAIAAGIPTPKAYVIKDSALNAFATGRDPKHGSITVTTGLLQNLNREELEGVIAHEMAHIKNYDIRMMLFAAVFVGAIILLSDMMLRGFLFGGGRSGSGNDNKGNIVIIVVAIALAILAPFIAQLVKLSISRKREFAADAAGALLTRYPPGLAHALKKISKDPDPLVDKANKATAHLFISTPFRKKTGWWTRIWSTHPPIQDRIKRLEQM